MKYIKIKALVIGVAAVGLLSTTGCKKSYLDINSNPNAVTESNVTAELIFPSAAVRVGGRTATGNLTFLQSWMGYYSQPGDFAIDQEQTSYNITFTFGQAFWQNHYDVLFDLEQTRKKALVAGDSVLAGASMILSAKLWQELVDLYGNIPFTQAFHIEQTSTPAYDKDSTVYRILQGRLDQAISYMKGTARGTYSSVVGGIVRFGGTGGTNTAVTGTAAVQQPLWIKFANTLKLRMLIRTSEVATPGIDRNVELAKIAANGGVLGSGQSVNVNPGYADETGKVSPFFAAYGYQAVSHSDGNTSTRANKYIVDSMAARSDARLARLYRGVGATYNTQGGAIVGTRYGQSVPANPGGAASSKMGFGTAGTFTQDQWIFTSVESLFLLAEAVQRGWIAGTPAAAYQNAVNESFIWLGAGGATAGAAYTAGTPLANFANASVTLPSGFVFTPVKFIAYQKYIAMNSIDPIEAYSDLRRLDMIPDKGYLSVNPSRHAGNKLPNRLLYPQEEYTLNFANVSAQGDINKDNIFTTAKIFWQP
jgi:hypothetical protein